MNQQTIYTPEPSPYREHLANFKALAGKYGMAMIILVLNSYVIPYVFLYLTIFIGQLYGTNFLNPESGSYYFVVMLLNELSAYLVPTILLWALFKKERRQFIPDKGYKPIPAEALLMFLAGMSAGALGNMITSFINSIVDSIFGTGEIPDAFEGMTPQNIPELAVFGFCICVIAPIIEEFIFRDILLKPLRAYGDMTAVIVTGLIFGLYHGNFDQFAYAFLLGTFYSMIAVRYNSILPTVILHAINNFLVTLSTYLPGAFSEAGGEAKRLAEDISLMASFGVALMMFMGFAMLVFVIIAIAKKQIVFHNHNRFVPEPHALLDFAATPWTILGFVAMIAFFFVKI